MPDARARFKQIVFKEVNFNRETQETLKPIIIRDARDRECNFNDTWIDIFFFYSSLSLSYHPEASFSFSLVYSFFHYLSCSLSSYRIFFL